MGNSEVGHLNLGAGVDRQAGPDPDRRRDRRRQLLREPGAAGGLRGGALRPRGRLHLMGLVSDGGVHSGWEHIEALHRARRAARASPTSSCTRSPTAATRCRRSAPGTSRSSSAGCATRDGSGRSSGRYYAMDRDRRWERTKLAYDAIVHAEGLRAPTAAEAVADAYERDETDEFVRPTVIGDYDGVGGRRRGHPLQLPPRPRPAAGAGAGRARLRRVRPRRRAPGRS